MADMAVGELLASLGLKPRPRSGSSWLDLFERIESGLPIMSLESVTGHVAPGDTGLKYRIVPKATLSRRTVDKRLSAEESAKLVRLAKAWAFAKDVWQDEVTARRFLYEPHMLLQQRKPIDVILANEIGAALVTDILGRLRYGSAA
ncbi:MAG TPA: antitoxin Xre/MbcA/ParS toxin-binding domain-containing protein [Dongiaceae bacterium]|nr:antitoxin Xre/MbcA/ParS toxin-binding domain-containing protein [Dongiaceae bacterium]